MVARNYEASYAEAIFKQIEGFGEYGFPESHAASFALLVYVSAWIKRRHPDAFLAALLNSLPMGFYAAPQLVRDARAHGVAVRPVDVTVSDWDSTLEPRSSHEAVPACAERAIPGAQCAVPAGAEPGERSWRGSGPAHHAGARARAPFANVEGPWRAGPGSARMPCNTWPAPMRCPGWPVTGATRSGPWRAWIPAPRPCSKPRARSRTPRQSSRRRALGDAVLADYRALGLSLKGHPLALLRPALAPFKVQQAALLNAESTGRASSPAPAAW